jgi:hypothetical protein
MIAMIAGQRPANGRHGAQPRVIVFLSTTLPLAPFSPPYDTSHVDLAWDKGKVTRLHIISRRGGNCRLRLHTPLKAAGNIKLTAAQGENPNPLLPAIAGESAPHFGKNHPKKAQPVRFHPVRFCHPGRAVLRLYGPIILCSLFTALSFFACCF